MDPTRLMPRFREFLLGFRKIPAPRPAAVGPVAVQAMPNNVPPEAAARSKGALAERSG